MQSVSKLTNLHGKKVILRLDLNVPLKNGKITDTTRIDKILPTIEFLLKQNSKIVILSHVGRPKGKVIRDLSLKPIQEDIEKKLNEKTNLIDKNIYEIKKDLLDNFNEKILLIENIRFYIEEEKNDLNFAKHLASLGDIYVNDAFSCSHRAHASVCEISKFLPSFSGLQLDLEISALKKITSELSANPIVFEAYYQKNLVDKLNSNVRKLSFSLLVFCILLFFIAFILINNTIRLSVYSKRFLIRTMRLVGAKSNFIQKPFLINGFYQGVYSSIFAVFLLIGTIKLVQGDSPGTLDIADLKIKNSQY